MRLQDGQVSLLKARDGSESAASPSRREKPSKIDPFRDVIDMKLEASCKAMAIYGFIRTLGYSGGYGLVRNYCRAAAAEAARVATMRFETAPGRQAQVDWKEDMTLRMRDGTPARFNVFLMVLGFSRAKYIEMTLDKTQPTLMRCMLDAIIYFGGSPAEVLFDNMKTVADRSQGEFGQGKVNSAFAAFAKDCLFEPMLCKAMHPYTKGKAEDLAKLMERLRPYDGEFSSLEELNSIVRRLLEGLNSEASQATGRKPSEALLAERPLLRMPDADAARRHHLDVPAMRKVSREALVTFEGCKYSVMPKMIGKTVELTARDGTLTISLGNEIVSTHRITGKRWNFDKQDYIAIMKSKAYRDVPDDQVERVAESNLRIYDQLGAM
ncbi:MAG: IS21 family transposase [Bacilli bacterium]|nr:IS21 family transposase [Bacilli bacterium]